MSTSITIHSYEIEMRNGNSMRIEGSGDTETVEVCRDVESTVRAYLAQGDYSEGGEERVVAIEIDGEHYRSYAASRIRRFQSARKSRRMKTATITTQDASHRPLKPHDGISECFVCRTCGASIDPIGSVMPDSYTQEDADAARCPNCGGTDTAWLEA